MAHDTHFLSRIERLESAQAELALSLYHDSELVRYVLSKADLSDAAERVAISLDDPEQGPFIIVARDGGFVTCLGAGMRLGAGQPVITRQRLDTMSGRVGALRQAMDQAERSTDHCRRLVEKVLDAGNRLSREDFDELSRLTPLLSGHYFHGLVGAHTASLEAYARLERARRLVAPRHTKALRLYWSATWAISHFALLLAADGPQCMGELFERMETMLPEHRGQRADLLPWSLVRLGVSSFVARGAWAASKLARVLFADLKHAWLHATSINTATSFGLGLSAIGLRHRRYRAEIHKVLARPGPPDEHPYLAKLRELMSVSYDAACEAPEPLREAVPKTAHQLLQQFYEQEGVEYQRVPDDAAAAILLSVPMSMEGDYSLLHLLTWLPWLVQAEARDFYLPADLVTLERWRPEESIAIIEPRRRHYHPRGVSSIDRTKPRRKGACPCGSGKKYKRCCGVDDGAHEPLTVDHEALGLPPWPLDE